MLKYKLRSGGKSSFADRERELEYSAVKMTRSIVAHYHSPKLATGGIFQGTKEVDIHATTAKTALKTTRHSFIPMAQVERDAEPEASYAE